ncbi:MAG TPA: hypothetical protein VFE16_06790 [Candidatus Cybelea sp.]|jgi:hypothetical protein|nr:hypothetical protein [Candidatus Cybelea sp.]
MTGLWSIYALVRADVLERTRCYQYLATVAVTLLVGTLLVPGRHASYETFLIDGYRGIYNSAWIGANFALLTAMLLSLFAFYNVKSAVERDRTTRVGEILATTSIGRFDYSLGKALSNFVVLGSMAAILCLTAMVMQFVRGESYAFAPLQILIPFAVVVMPLIAMVAAIAVLFEMVPWLRGGFGNAVYFFGWTAYLVWSVQDELRGVPWWRDMLGANLVMRKVWEALLRVDPRAKPNSIEIGVNVGAGVRHFFTFMGFHWTVAEVAERLVWFAIALCIVAAAALLFDRFSKPARSTEQRRGNAVVLRWRTAAGRLSAPLVDALFGSDFGSIVLAEFRLLVRGLSLWWYVVAGGLWLFALFADATGQSLAVGLAWIWPMLQWSQLGTRETVFATEQFVYPTVHPIRRQFVAQWFAGVLLALVSAGGSLVHWTIAGNFTGLEGVLAGAVFVPTLALACGALSGTTRLFEIAYLVLWYLGPMNRTPFDFTQGAYAPQFTLASVVLFVVAVGARTVRLRYA